MEIPDSNNDFYANSMQAAATEFDFLGFGKKAKERREERQESRAEKKAAKTDIKKAKAEAIRGGTFQSGASQVLGSVVDGAKTFLGINTKEAAAPADKAPADNNDNVDSDDAAGKNKMPAWAWIAIAIVLLVIVYFLFFNKKGKK
ncbi:MAG: hypothetical protein RB294_10155 [Bacteroidales bacterium]|nr:hypothetical protein [Bacteroidales bacterium]